MMPATQIPAQMPMMAIMGQMRMPKAQVPRTSNNLPAQPQAQQPAVVSMGMQLFQLNKLFDNQPHGCQTSTGSCR